MSDTPAWLARWQQTDEDELLYEPQHGGRVERVSEQERRLAAPWVTPGLAWNAASLRQMARERWPEPEERR